MQIKFEQAFAQCEQPLKDAILSLLLSPIFDATISPQDFKKLLSSTKLSEDELKIQLLPFAASLSIAPISQFHVGAIAKGKSGRLYFGANMEFTGLPLNQSVHAEQSAICHAWLKGEPEIIDITINYSPCGHCRQFMNELHGAENLLIQLPNLPAKKLAEYLPDAFGPSDLLIDQPLLTPINHGLPESGIDELTNAAIDALNKSHAPYSKNLCGLALRTPDGQIFTGRYAENAAFNPSISPFQVALISMTMAGVEVTDINEVSLVELHYNVISLKEECERLLHQLNPQAILTYHQL